MTDEDDGPDQSASEPGGEDVHDDSGIRIPIDASIFGSLIPFRDLQRTVAAMDFGGIRAAQQTMASMAAKSLGLEALQGSVQAQIAKSVDFSALAGVREIWANADITKDLIQQAKWAETLAGSFHLSALQQVNDLLASTAFPAVAETQRSIAAALKAHTQEWVKSFHSIDISQLLENLDRWLPDNLRDVDDLEEVARIALDEGLPLSWIPRTSLVQVLIAAASIEERLDILETHRDEIIVDCELALDGVPHQWAQECTDAIQALKGNLDGPAQSHAANIIDSIVLCALGPKDGRQLAKIRAVEDWEGLALRVAGESLVLRPLYLALVTWWPGRGTPPPDHFARHATAHAVGQPGLFQRRHALIAVMLAVSLTLQFWDDSASAEGLLPVVPLDDARRGTEPENDINDLVSPQ